MAIHKDISGQKFGRLVAIEFKYAKEGNAFWMCKCECGAEIITRGQYLRNGHTKSCGCLSAELVKESSITHGLSNSNEYDIWINMKTRCYNPNSIGYKNYGGRDIKICERWMESFESFLSDMGKRPSLKHSIDRIDNNGNYEPENCRWATWSEQMKNRRPFVRRRKEKLVKS